MGGGGGGPTWQAFDMYAIFSLWVDVVDNDCIRGMQQKCNCFFVCYCRVVSMSDTFTV